MLLVMELIGKRGGSLGRESRRVFNESGGEIGRAADCTWVLPEAWVSGVHARIAFRDGGFWITDTSSNGITLPDANADLVPGQAHLIGVGDRFEIGEFLIQATILDDNGLPQVADPMPPRALG